MTKGEQRIGVTVAFIKPYRTDSLGSLRAPVLHRRGVGTWKRFQPSRGRGVLQLPPPQISACFYLWLTVIYADFFLYFFHTCQTLNTFFSIKPLGVCPSFEMWFCFVVFCLYSDVSRLYILQACRAGDNCMLSSDICCGFKKNPVCTEVNRKRDS